MIATAREISARQAALKNRGDYLLGRAPPYTDEWYTPPAIVLALGPFDLDPSAGPATRCARRNIRPPADGLRVRWRGRVWLNPPYSNVSEWLERFVAHADGVALVNARPETGWFQRLAAGAVGLLFLKGRLKFARNGKPAGNPPCGSVLVAYGPRNLTALKTSGLPGLLLLTPNP